MLMDNRCAMPYTDEEAVLLVRECFAGDGVVAFDTETSGLLTWREDVVVGGVSLASASVPGGVYLPMRHNSAPLAADGAHKSNVSPAAVFGAINECARGKSVVMHNAKYDCSMLAGEALFAGRGNPFEFFGQVHDTMIMSQLLYDDGRSHSLKDLAAHELGTPADEQARLKAFLKAASTENYLDAPPDIMLGYAAGDAVRTLALYKLFWDRLQAEEMGRVYLMEMSVMPAIVAAELQGISVDTGYMGERAAEGTAIMEKQSKVARDLLGHDINLGSTHEIHKAWVFELGLEERLAERYHKGKGFVHTPTYDEETLRAGDNDLARCILEYRKWSKLVGTYFEGLSEFVDGGGRLHPQFFQCGTVTGRMSSSKPNMQNVPRGPEVKRMFRASPGQGNILLFIDYSQFEYRMFAHYCQDEALTRSFCTDDAFDIHAQVTSMVGAPDRATGKTLNFAMLYGMGSATYAKKYGTELSALLEAVRSGEAELEGAIRCKTPLDLATLLFNRYHSKLPAAKKFSHLASSRMRSRGYVKTLLGRRRHYDGDNDWKATNSLIQGSTSDYFKGGLHNLAALFGLSDLRSSPFRLFIHDEVCLELPASALGDLAPYLNAMAAVVPLRVPVRVDCKYTEYTWADAVDGPSSVWRPAIEEEADAR